MDKSIAELRAEIDMLDSEILCLLEKRFQLTDDIGRQKLINNFAIFDKTRENEKIRKISFELSGSQYTDKLCAVYKALMVESKISQSQILYGKNTVFLVGMPGCGKTTVGSRLAEKLCANHMDLDAEFKNLFRATPEIFINQMGEEKFRKAESLVLQLSIDRVKALHNNFENAGFVISCGGGIVLKKENTELMKNNGTIIYIQRDLAALATDNRPISQTKGIESIFSERKEMYEGCTDFSVENIEVDKCVEQILCKLSENNS